MNEQDNVRDVLKGMIEIAEAPSITTDGKEITVKDLQELFLERAYNLADLLGLESLYLRKKKEC